MIFTLPITVRDGAPLGYWLTPILVDALSKQLCEKGILFYGELGLRSPTFSTARMFHERLNFLNLICERKSDAGLRDELLALVRQVLLDGTVTRRRQECYRCPCGCLELPTAIASFAKEKTFRRIGKAYVCKVCHKTGEIASVDGEFLVMRPIQYLDSTGVYPKWYRAELEDITQQLLQQGIPVSRSRETGLRQSDRNLDVEFVWLLIPLLLSLRNCKEPIRFVVTNHVLRQAATSLLLAKSFNPNFKADLIVSPCISHPGVLEKWKLGRLIELGFTGDLIRFMLVGSLGWQAKDVALYDVPATVEHRRFSLLKLRTKEAQDNGRTIIYTPSEALHNLCQQNLTQGLRHVFNPDRFDYATLRGLF